MNIIMGGKSKYIQIQHFKLESIILAHYILKTEKKSTS